MLLYRVDRDVVDDALVRSTWELAGPEGLVRLTWHPRSSSGRPELVDLTAHAPKPTAGLDPVGRCPLLSGLCWSAWDGELAGRILDEASWLDRESDPDELLRNQLHRAYEKWLLG